MCSVNVDANPGAATRHMQENPWPCQKLKITVISGFRTKIAVVANYRAKIILHCRGFWLPYKNYCGDQLPCITVVAGYRTKYSVVANYRPPITVQYRGGYLPWQTLPRRKIATEESPGKNAIWHLQTKRPEGTSSRHLWPVNKGERTSTSPLALGYPLLGPSRHVWAYYCMP